MTPGSRVRVRPDSWSLMRGAEGVLVRPVLDGWLVDFDGACLFFGLTELQLTEAKC